MMLFRQFKHGIAESHFEPDLQPEQDLRDTELFKRSLKDIQIKPHWPFFCLSYIVTRKN